MACQKQTWNNLSLLQRGPFKQAYLLLQSSLLQKHTNGPLEQFKKVPEKTQSFSKARSGVVPLAVVPTSPHVDVDVTIFHSGGVSAQDTVVHWCAPVHQHSARKCGGETAPLHHRVHGCIRSQTMLNAALHIPSECFSTFLKALLRFVLVLLQHRRCCLATT